MKRRTVYIGMIFWMLCLTLVVQAQETGVFTRPTGASMPKRPVREVVETPLEQDSARSAELVKQGNEYRINGQLIKALRCFVEACRTDTTNHQAAQLRVRTMISMGNYQQSIQQCQRMLRRDSTDFSAWRMKGVCENRLDLDADAFQSLSTAYALAPNDGNVVGSLTTLLLDFKDYEEVLRVCDRYREQDSLDIVVNENAAEAYFRQDKYVPALIRYNQLYELGDHSFYTMYFRGMCHYGLGHFYNAYEDLSKARYLQPDNENLLYYLAISAEKSGHMDDALEYIEAAHDEVVPNDSTLSWLYNGMAQVYNQAHQNEDYEEVMLKMYDLNPQRIGILYTLGYNQEFTDPKKARQTFQRYVKVVPERLKTHHEGETDREKRLTDGYNHATYYIEHFDEIQERQRQHEAELKHRQETQQRQQVEQEFWIRGKKKG